jgi:hypothetical protein
MFEAKNCTLQFANMSLSDDAFFPSGLWPSVQDYIEGCPSIFVLSDRVMLLSDRRDCMRRSKAWQRAFAACSKLHVDLYHGVRLLEQSVNTWVRQKLASACLKASTPATDSNQCVEKNFLPTPGVTMEDRTAQYNQSVLESAKSLWHLLQCVQVLGNEARQLDVSTFMRSARLAINADG